MLTELADTPLILLVEDDPSHAAAIQRSFENAPESYRLKIVGTLQEAREAITMLQPALVLTDYRLPDGDGSDLAHLAHEAWPMILMTAKGSEEIAVKALKSGVQDYVVKSAQTFARMHETINHSLKAWSLVLARKQAEEALRESEEKHRLLYERMSLAAKTASFGVWDWDITTDEATWDDTMFEIYGIPKTSKVPLETLIDIVYPGDFNCALESLKHNIDKGGRVVEFKIVRPDGQIRYIYSAEGFIRNEENEVTRIVGVSTDITERKQAEETLRRYARRLVEMEEALRKKLAAELHDEIARDLTVIGMNFSIISSALTPAATKKLQARIEDSARLIEGISRNTRNIMAGLRPPVLDDYGLPSALRWHSALFSARSCIEVTLHADESFPRLPPEMELALFRISQEALMNIAKHANAKSVTTTLSYEPGLVRFSVSDDGTGFTLPSVDHLKLSGWGMTIMRERAELVGGKFSYISHPGEGTTVAVEIPLEVK
jgi:signal transduction histidine kinase